ncbi:MAG: haloacid dehalogenase-like hydrolase [Deltaproteobacteria bacterium]|nr:haloacid dehalogenase-like hydrolase [Deltaproteobacteria bacterium]
MSQLNGLWSEKTKQRLENWLGKVTKPGNGRQPPLAIFDFDKTVIQNDVGEAVFHYLAENMKLAYSSSLYKHIGERYEAKLIEEAVKRLLPLSPEQRRKDPLYRKYQKAILGAYYHRIEQEGSKAAYPWVVAVFAGLSEREMYQLTGQAIKEELRRAITEEEIRTDPADQHPLHVKRGIRLYPEIEQLMRLMKEVGVEVWVVSASARWIIQKVLEQLKLPVDNFIGMAVEVRNGILTSDPVHPQPMGPGKLEAILKQIGRIPNFVAGDSPSDFAMMESATEISLLIDSGNPETRSHAEKNGWLIQTAF